MGGKKCEEWMQCGVLLYMEDGRGAVMLQSESILSLKQALIQGTDFVMLQEQHQAAKQKGDPMGTWRLISRLS